MTIISSFMFILCTKSVRTWQYFANVIYNIAKILLSGIFFIRHFWFVFATVRTITTIHYFGIIIGVFGYTFGVTPFTPYAPYIMSEGAYRNIAMIVLPILKHTEQFADFIILSFRVYVLFSWSVGISVTVKTF